MSAWRDGLRFPVELFGLVGSLGNAWLAYLTWLEHGKPGWAAVWMLMGLCAAATCLKAAWRRVWGDFR